MKIARGNRKKFSSTSKYESNEPSHSIEKWCEYVWASVFDWAVDFHHTQFFGRGFFCYLGKLFLFLVLLVDFRFVVKPRKFGNASSISRQATGENALITIETEQNRTQICFMFNALCCFPRSLSSSRVDVCVRACVLVWATHFHTAKQKFISQLDWPHAFCMSRNTWNIDWIDLLMANDEIDLGHQKNTFNRAINFGQPIGIIRTHGTT